jgi:carbon monoxide dehydrogenase subunit G
MSEFKSEVKQIQAPQTAVYTKLSDLKNLDSVKRHMSDPEAVKKLADHMGQDKVEKMSQYLENVEFDIDTITVSGTPVGNVCLRIIEREEPKTIKMQVEGVPFSVNMWIQMLPNGSDACALRVVLKADLNFFIKQMVSKPLQQVVDGIAEFFARIPY